MMPPAASCRLLAPLALGFCACTSGTSLTGSTGHGGATSTAGTPSTGPTVTSTTGGVGGSGGQAPTSTASTGGVGGQATTSTGGVGGAGGQASSSTASTGGAGGQATGSTASTGGAGGEATSSTASTGGAGGQVTASTASTGGAGGQATSSTGGVGGAGGASCVGVGKMVCGGTCVDTTNDAANCGACNNVCAANETCAGSMCLCGGAACAAGNACCGGTTCVNFALDPNNCGACGAACPIGDNCSASGCSDWADWPMPNPVSTGLPHPGNYTAMAGYVLDNVTGLWWQQPIGANNNLSVNCAGGCTQAQALAYCANLTLAGHSDWRLPTRIELVSIIDSTVWNPSINASVFPGTPANLFWTSSPFARAISTDWYVNFQDGSTYNVSAGAANAVRCVR